MAHMAISKQSATLDADSGPSLDGRMSSSVVGASPVKEVAGKVEIQWYYNGEERVYGCEERRGREIERVRG